MTEMDFRYVSAAVLDGLLSGDGLGKYNSQRLMILKKITVLAKILG